MKKIIVYLLFLTGMDSAAFAQLSGIDTTINLDLLKSPVSPAFNMLGIGTSAIERYTDFNAFRVSIQNATKNFTTIPNSYAFEIAPFLVGSKKYTLNDFNNTKYTIPQTFVVSAGFTHMGPEGKEDVDSLKTTKVALGIKFSIIRPGWSVATKTAYENLIAVQKELLQQFQKNEKQHASYVLYAKKREELRTVNRDTTLSAAVKATRLAQLARVIDSLEVLINDDTNNQLSTNAAASYLAVQKAATSFKSERQGFFLDFTSGFSLDFPDNRFNNSYVQKAGAWLTGGHENGNKGITSMFIARYLYQPNAIFADPTGKLSTDKVSTFDAGARFLLSALNDKLNLSGEALYRSILGNSQLDPSWRLIFNAEYDIGKNRRLTFSFGRNFDGTISKGGNLIAAINFIAGFGGERKITN
jgi:hypothetical protein